MPASGRPRPAAHGQRGTTLLESMVAFVLLALAALAVVRLHGELRWQTDLARQRSEAIRLGGRELESLRAWSSLDPAPGATSYAAIVTGAASDDAASAPGSNAAYRVVRLVDDATFDGAKLTSVAVEWDDRGGAAQRLVLDSVIARSDPAWSGALALGSGSGAPRGVLGRAPAIPVGAVSVGGGRSALKTTAASGTAALFDDATGEAVARCTGIAASTATRDLAPADLAACTAGHWLLVSGTIRFTDTAPPSPVDANDAPPAVEIGLALTDGPYAAPAECGAEPMKTVRYAAAGSVHLDTVPADALPASLGLAAWTETGDRHVAYRCFVAPRADGRWSGRTSLLPAGWSVGTGSGDRRVCRYTGGPASAFDANIAHPDAYRDVGAALPAQNFLVVRGDQACPAAAASGVLAGAFGTVQHQP